MKNLSIRDSVILRMGIVAVLGLVLLIPISFTDGLVSERKQLRDKTLNEITEKWGGPQILSGPILTVPIKRIHRNKEGEITWTTTEHAHILPDSLTVDARLAPEVRYRGIYHAVLYNSQFRIEADFPAPQFPESQSSDHEILWAEAFLTIGISDLKGVRSITGAMQGEQPLTPEPGLRTKDLVLSGFTMRLPLSPGGKPGRFAIEASVNGSEEIQFVPLAAKTSVVAGAPWGAPSFTGSFLPEKREITENSFNAQWSVLHFNRNVPQSWTGPQIRLQDSSFGVKLLLPVDEYQKNARAVKYAIMFIALTFLAFTVTDVLSRSPFHPIHYSLVGLALILFFVLLLSISEHLGFNLAYVIAGIPSILLISMYTRWITGKWRITGAIAGTLSVLYLFLFVVLQLEDYALLMGSVGLFTALSTVMYLTRRIDWFAAGTSGKSAGDLNCLPGPCAEQGVQDKES